MSEDARRELVLALLAEKLGKTLEAFDLSFYRYESQVHWFLTHDYGVVGFNVAFSDVELPLEEMEA